MKNIYMIQACDVHGSGETESAYLPYATGLLIAYSFKDELIKKNFAIKRFIYKKENIDEAIESLDSPAVIGFSTYIWNYEYNKTFARRVKERYPSCIIIFGGHNVSSNSARQLNEYPFIDFLIHGEGEKAFHDILVHLCTDNAFASVPNISYRDQNGHAIKNPSQAIYDLDYPSPYLEGYFDEMIEKEDIIFSALLETNRGCPNRCAYCDWGSIQLKMRAFPMERITEEIRWLAKKKIAFCFCIDSNFGMFKRDFEIVDTFLRIKAETGYPEMFKCCTTEGSGMAEFNINKKLNDCGILKGASLALQTLCPEALENIGRRNMSLERYGNLSELYNQAHIPTYSELIYGMPGETYTSFSENLCHMLESGTTRGCFIHFCELLMNSALATPEAIEKYKIKTLKMPYTQFHSEPENGIREFSEIIVSTYSLSFEDWVKTVIFGLFIQCFHFMGITQYIAKFLYYEAGISYRDFYEKLIEFAQTHPKTLIGICYSEISDKLNAPLKNQMISRVFIDPAYGGIEFPLEEGMCLRVLSDSCRFFREMNDFFRSWHIDEDLCRDLIDYQAAILRSPEDTEKTISCDHDFYGYFTDINRGERYPLQKKRIQFFLCNRYRGLDKKTYAQKIVWYGRKSSLTIYTDDEISCS